MPAIRCRLANTAGDIALPSGTSLITDAETVVVIIAEAPSAEQLDAEVAEAAGELGIVEDQPAEASGAAAAEQPQPAEASAE